MKKRDRSMGILKNAPTLILLLTFIALILLMNTKASEIFLN